MQTNWRRNVGVIAPAFLLVGCANFQGFNADLDPSLQKYHPVRVDKQSELVTVGEVISAISRDINETGRFRVHSARPGECVVDLYASPKSFTLTLKTVANFEADASLGGNLPFVIVVTPTLTATNKTIDTQQIDLPINVILDTPADKLPDGPPPPPSKHPTDQEVLRRTLIGVLQTYRDIPHPKGSCDRYPQGITLTSTFQVEDGGTFDVKATSLITGEGKVIASSDAYQTLVINYSISGSPDQKPDTSGEHPSVRVGEGWMDLKTQIPLPPPKP